MSGLIKTFYITIIITFFSLNVHGSETKKDCSQIKNLYKKIVCKTNNATSIIVNKKNLVDYVPSKDKKK